MFLEIPTIWKKKAKRVQHETPPEQSRLKRWRTSSFFTDQSNSLGESSPSIWRPRRLGIFFSKHGKMGRVQATTGVFWTCLVLVEPMNRSQMDKPDADGLLFCYRDIEEAQFAQETNAYCINGPCYYSIEEDTLQNVIKYFTVKLLPKEKEFPQFAIRLGKDICWGWEMFLTQVMQMVWIQNISSYCYLG